MGIEAKLMLRGPHGVKVGGRVYQEVSSFPLGP